MMSSSQWTAASSFNSASRHCLLALCSFVPDPTACRTWGHSCRRSKQHRGLLCRSPHPLDRDGAPTKAFEPSLFVWATVMSRPTDDRAIVDAGLRRSAFDSGPPAATYERASDEHGRLGIHQPPQDRRQDPPRPRPLRPDRQPLRLVRLRPRQPRRAALAHHRERCGLLNPSIGQSGNRPQCSSKRRIASSEQTPTKSLHSQVDPSRTSFGKSPQQSVTQDEHSPVSVPDIGKPAG
jgi:hypothetical protein